MKVKEKILLGQKELEELGPITIVALGDSITHGGMNGYVDQENVYHNRLKKKLNAYRDYMPVNVINSGIGGTTAGLALENIENRVFRYCPDLVTVCFGLNDVHTPLETYLTSLEGIFKECKKREVDVIFMTPNTMNTYVAKDTEPSLLGFAERTAKEQTDGTMDKYIYAAIDLAKKLGVPVCDCYSEWKELAKTKDTTMLLANRINHPLPEMHELFAEKLFNAIINE